MPTEDNVTSAGAAAAPARFLGFDTSIYPGDQKMRTWKANSPYVFTGYYLKAPCHGNASWSGSRPRLAAMGWGFAVVYVGRQVHGPCSGSTITPVLGVADGKDAVAKARAEGFAPNTVVYLDVEAMDAVTDAVKQYIQAWFAQVVGGGFVPGMYCHVKNAAELKTAALTGYPPASPAPIFWVAGGKKAFNPDTSGPADSGIDFAGLWQGRLDTTDTHGDVKLAIDIDVADTSDPSGVYVTAADAAPASFGIGDAAAAPAPETAGPPSSIEQVNTIIQRNLDLFDSPNIVSVRAGYQSVAGQPTGRLAIVVKVMNYNPDDPSVVLPQRVEGVPIDVRQATVVEQLSAINPAAAVELAQQPGFEQPLWEFSYGAAAQAAAMDFAPSASAKPTVKYEPAAVPLNPVEDVMTINCHASPDAGWPNLKPFLEGTRKTLTVGMYDFDADHISTAFQSAVRGKKLTMVLDGNPTGPDEHPLEQSLATELGKDLQFAWAAEGNSPDVTAKIFPNAYHIKVAVRDSHSMWLSSGNWQVSNQPDIDPLKNAADRSVASKRNREWHVIVDHPGLASIYEQYIDQDFKQASQVQAKGGPASFGITGGAVEPEFFIEDLSEDETGVSFGVTAARPERRFFAPLVLANEKIRIQPILTPDNYGQHILPLIKSAKKSFYMQTQYIHADKTGPATLVSLVNAIQERVHAGVDVRLIVHEREAQDDWIEKLHGDFGFDTSLIRVQPGIHNKGMVVDSQIAVVGSQNWSGAGVTTNRDASVILFNEQIAKYFEQIFVHDWTTLARTYVHKTPRVLAAKPGEPTPAGFRRVKLSELNN